MAMTVQAGPDAAAGFRARVAALTRAGAGSPAPHRLVLWAPVALGLGAAVYFGLRAEPPEWMIGAAWASAGALALLALSVRHRPGAVYAAALAACALAGFALAEGRARALAPPDMPAYERVRAVEGWIEAIEASGARDRLLIRVSALEDVEPPPERVRVIASAEGLEPGDAVRVPAVLAPPRGPVAPGGYDGARAAWFDQIALTGFAIADPESVALAGDGAERNFLHWRWRLAERIEEKAGERAGGIIAALLTGDRSGIVRDDAEALRMSGLGHVLAISGLHMALVALGVFGAARLALASWDRFARAHDPRKPAALIALAAGLGYLVLSGGAVSTQRAFIMAAVVLVGVLIDRRGFTMNGLALAALIVLIAAPESVFMVGAQMSFAAAAALVAAYEMWRRLGPLRLERTGWIGRARDFLAGLFFTSLVAGAATGAFAVFHFQRMAVYGLLGNMAAMPVFTAWVMPAAVGGLALAPIGLDAPFLMLAERGMRIVLAIAHWTASLPGADAPARAAPGHVIALYGLGFAALCVGQGAARLAGGAVVALAYALWAAHPSPQMAVTEDGIVLARFEDAPEDWAVSDVRRGRFGARVFHQRLGLGDAVPPRADLSCDALGCYGVTREGLRVAIAERPEALTEDCARADLVVLRGEASRWQTRRCPAIVLDAAARRALGGAELWVENGEIVRAQGANRSRGDRLWSPR